MDPILFGPFCLDLNQRRVFRDRIHLKLRPQAVRVLRVLLQGVGKSVHYDQLFGIRTENRPLEELAPEEAPLGMTGVKAVKA